MSERTGDASIGMRAHLKRFAAAAIAAAAIGLAWLIGGAAPAADGGGMGAGAGADVAVGAAGADIAAGPGLGADASDAVGAAGADVSAAAGAGPGAGADAGAASAAAAGQSPAAIGASPADAPGGFSLSDLLDESSEFDLESMLGDFDPDADFGGLGLEPEHGPGSITIDVVGLDGERIEGIAITEDGFRNGMVTSFDAPCAIADLPYGERLFDVLAPFSYDYVSASMAYYVGGARVEVALPGGRPGPVAISDEALRWELTVVLREHMRMKADYYLVSPNNRFYGLQMGPGAPPEYRAAAGPPLGAYVPYELNTFEGAPARLAIYMQMPSLRGVSRVTLVGSGFGDAGGEWTADGEMREFSLTDWSATQPTWQLPSFDVRFPDGDGAVGTRFVVFLLPESRDGARIRLDGVRVEMADGSVAVFENAGLSDVEVRIVDVPKRN